MVMRFRFREDLSKNPIRLEIEVPQKKKYDNFAVLLFYLNLIFEGLVWSISTGILFTATGMIAIKSSDRANRNGKKQKALKYGVSKIAPQKR